MSDQLALILFCVLVAGVALAWVVVIASAFVVARRFDDAPDATDDPADLDPAAYHNGGQP